jgi:2-polyprenyl-6-methoxyphenol hydroxylase-like FAD-dependent oxidoreductase
VGADVIVVGAGPVGLMLAGELRLGGADVVVYDKLPAPTGESRALGFNRRVAESLDQRGLLTRIGGFRWGPQGHFGGVRIDLGMLDETHNGVLGLPQAAIEETLAGWLADLGVQVRRGYEAVGMRQDADGVLVTLDGPGGRREEAGAYLAGCDGGQSIIRRLAGIEAHGWESTRGMYTAEITGIEMPPRPIGERLPGGNMVVCTNLGDDRYRIVIQARSLPPHPDPEALTFAEVADAWQRLTGDSIHHARPLWMWACGNSARLATGYRRGRVFLAGDAAHDTPPLAAWGLSAGILDAVNLGWKLAAAVTGWGDEALLDSYSGERHPIGERLMRDIRAASMLYLGGDEMEPLRDVLRELVAWKDAAGFLAGEVSGLGIRYEVGAGEHPLLGKRMPPERRLVLAGQAATRVADLLNPARGVFVTTEAASENARLASGWADRVDVVAGHWDEAGPAEAGPAEAGPAEALIRPDGYVAWTAPGGGDLATALARWFGAPRAAEPLAAEPRAAEPLAGLQPAASQPVAS